MGFWDRKKSGKILKMAVFSLFLLFFCTQICVYAAENHDFSREEEALGELDLKEVEMAVDQLLEEKQSMRGMIRDILKSGQAFSAEQWKAVIQQACGMPWESKKKPAYTFWCWCFCQQCSVICQGFFRTIRSEIFLFI